MSTHLEALERMATRGSPRGANVLVRDIRESLDDRTLATVRSDRSGRRPSGPVWAGVAAVLVLAVGVVGSWVAGWSEETSPTGVLWHRVEASAPVGIAAAGPVGFVSAGLAANRGVWFSADGVSWEQASLPAGGEAFIDSVFSTTGGWLVTGFSEASRLGWWSADGRVWRPVDWPAEIEGTIQQVAATGDDFFALSRDVFDEGTSLWRSADAQTWTEIPTGPVTATGFLEGVSGGLVFRSEAEVSVSTDGTTWTTSNLVTPAELGEGSVRVETIQYLGNRWLAFIEVQRVNQGPVLALMSSASGQLWEFEGIPPFGQLEGLAPGLQATGTIGERLVVVPVEIPTSTQEDGTVTADGFVRNSGQIWSTTDASEWTLELSADLDIHALAGGIVEGQPVGIWIGLGSDSEGTVEQPVVTTTADMPDEPLDPDGLEFQAAVVADGTVTFEEFEQAAEHWKTCMEEHGVTEVEYTIDRSGGMSQSYASPSPDGATENAIANLCDESWVSQVIATLTSH